LTKKVIFRRQPTEFNWLWNERGLATEHSFGTFTTVPELLELLKNSILKTHYYL
jgi:hypothetical protein